MELECVSNFHSWSTLTTLTILNRAEEYRQRGQKQCYRRKVMKMVSDRTAGEKIKLMRDGDIYRDIKEAENSGGALV